MKNNSASWLLSVIGKKKIYILILLILQTVLGGSSVVYALLLRNVIDSATEKNSYHFAINVALIAGLVAGQILLRAFQRRIEELSRSTYENRLKSRLFSNLLRKDYAGVTTIHSGEWINRLTNDTVVCAGGLTDILPGALGMLVKMVGALIMILALEPKFAYIIIPGGLVMLLFTYSFRKILKRLHKSIQEKDGKLRVFFQDNLSSMIVVRSFGAENQTEAEAEQKMAEHQKARLKRNSFSNICNSGFGAAMNGMYLIGVIYCSRGIMKGEITYGTLMALLQLIAQIQTPFATITGYLPRYYAMTASAERLMTAEAFENPQTENSVKAGYEDIKSFGFKNAGFSYLPVIIEENSEQRYVGISDRENPKQPVVLKGINLDIKRGEYIALTGHSGCGKSTILKLLMCLYPLDEGERYIRTAGGEFPLSAADGLFAYVPQGNHLMSGTIREMVAFSDKSHMNDDERISRALKISCADEFISELENGADTQLGERGQGLSEGQMQRIAIARAIFSDSPVLLLDEATSALDDVTEQHVLENLRSMTDKTVLIVTHRPKALEFCDRIFEFSEDGVVKKQLY